VKLRAQFFSLIYRATRFFVSNFLYFVQWILRKPKDLEPAVKFGDKALSTFSTIGSPFFKFKLPNHDEIDVYGLKFPSPLIASSFKSKIPILNMWLKMGLGGVTFKTILENERGGNPRPRLQDAPYLNQKNILNSMGLPGPGIDLFCEQIKTFSVWTFGRPVGISIGGDSLNEYGKNIKKVNQTLGDFSNPYYYELNISCPNTENGKTIGENPNELDQLLKEIRQITDAIIAVKVSPDLPNDILIQIGEVCSSHEKIIINAGNTQFKKPNDVGVHHTNFSMPGGGFSGPILFQRTLEMVHLFSKFKLPIIATGGISTIHHVRAAQNQGASLCGMATALVLDPFCIPKINSQL